MSTLTLCLCNSFEDMEALPRIVVRVGRKVDSAIRPEELKGGTIELLARH